jgi:hypothetical protein
MSDLERKARESSLADDLLLGCKPIGDFLGMTERQVYHAGATGQLPLFKFAGKIAGRKSRLTQYVIELERAAEAAAKAGATA